MCTIQEYIAKGGKVNLVKLTENYLKKRILPYKNFQYALVCLVLRYRSIYQANTEIPVL